MSRGTAEPWGTTGILAFLALAWLAGCTRAANSGPALTISLTAAGRAIRDTPLSATLPAAAGSNLPTVARLEAEGGGPTLPAQLERTPEGTRITWIEKFLEQGQTRRYRLHPGGASPTLGSAEGVLVKPNREDGSVEVLVNGQLFTGYETRTGAKPFLFPLHAVGGGELTRNFPMKLVQGESRDHWHQRSCWFTHDEVNGVHFWNEQPGHGRQVHRKYEALESGPVFGAIRALTDWLGPDGKQVCEDTRAIRVYALTSARMFDFDITVRASNGPLTFGDTKEGTFGVRVASTLDVDRKLGGQIVNARGRRNAAAWGRKAEWVDYSGPVGGETLGIAILDHPENLRHPTTWHVRTYGLSAANPFGLHEFPDGRKENGSFTVPAGGSLRFRYRVLIHAGRAAEAHVETAWDGYAHPPRIEVRSSTGAGR